MSLLLLITITGCASYTTQISTSQEYAKETFRDEPIPLIYGGVQMDIKMIKELYSNDDGSDPAGLAQARVLGTPILIIDFMFSVVLDTILLPYSIYKTLNNDTNNTKITKP